MSKVIEIENLSKVYDLGLVGTGTLSKDLNRTWAKLTGKPDPYATLVELNDRTKKSSSNMVYALKDINFSVNQGEVLGIIGKNGAGKSTLLKILSQITSPSTGTIKMKGRVASLLEVGTGMHPEMTARQNIYLNGSLMGMRRHEITSKLDEIVDFAGIEKYIDTPTKRFSSGMTVRLGFAIAAFLDPEVLIVDEVLAVGDAEFQKKAIGKMQDVSSGDSRTVLFVSHNMSSIRNLCDRVVVLNKGKIVFDGATEKGIDHYLKLNSSHDSKVFNNNYDLDQDVFVKKVSLINDSNKIEFTINKICFEFLIILKKTVKDLYLGIIIEDSRGNCLIVSSTDENKINLFNEIDGDNVKLQFSFEGSILKPGVYFLTFSLREKIGKPIHKEERTIQFEIIDTKTYRGLKNRYRESAIIAPTAYFDVI
jgi:lipopolysaccharide transport system ATP-binding protein